MPWPGFRALAARRSTILRISSPTPLLGTDGSATLSPFRGRVKVWSVLTRFLPDPREGLGIPIWCVLTLLLLSGSVAVFVVLSGSTLANPWAVALLCIAAVIAQRSHVEVNSALKASISMFPVLLAAVLFGPLAAMLVSAGSMLGESPNPAGRWIVYFAGRAITGAATGFVAVALLDAGDGSFPATLIATAGTAIAAQALDVGLIGLVLMLRGHRKRLALLRMLGPLLLTSLPFYAPVVSLLAFGYHEVSPWTLPLFLAPALAAQRFFILYQQERQLSEDLVEANQHLESANLSFATALVATLDARDRYTAGHSAAVAVYARDIATRLGLTEAETRLAHTCGLVHDIGKVGLPAGLLEKPGALTLEERRLMETHSEIGERILAKVDDYFDIARIVRHHHERVDGQGYPDGLVGDEIPIISRILAVADAYNAMTSDRPYRDAMPSPVARMRLAQAVESQFDTAVVAAFEAILAPATEDYKAGIRVDFTLEAQDHRTPALRAVSSG